MSRPAGPRRRRGRPPGFAQTPPEIDLSLIYLAALLAVAASILALAFDAVVSVSRKPQWHLAPERLVLVETIDRRTQQLPFVGTDRRQGTAAADTAGSQRRTG
jgi:hypothetical protein